MTVPIKEALPCPQTCKKDTNGRGRFIRKEPFLLYGGTIKEQDAAATVIVSRMPGP